MNTYPAFRKIDDMYYASVEPPTGPELRKATAAQVLANLESTEEAR